MGSLGEQFYDSVIRPVMARLFDEVHGPILWAVLWVTGWLALVTTRDGKDAIWATGPLVVAAAGAVVAALAGWWWIRRVQSLVLIAPFLFDGEAAAEEAVALHGRIVDALRAAAERVGDDPQWAVKVFDRAVDPGDAAAALRRVRSHRAPVLVAGKVRVDTGQAYWEVRILTPDPQLQWRPDASTSTRISVPVPELHTATEGTRTALTLQATGTATLALGIALLLKGKAGKAQTVLTTGNVTTPLSLFYAALAAWTLDRDEEAQQLASRSWELVPFAPTAALAAIASFNGGRVEDARAWRDRWIQAPRPGSTWADFLRDLELLALTYFTTDHLAETMGKVDAIQQETAQQYAALTARFASDDRARDLVRQGDFGGVLAELKPPPGPDRPQARAIYALAAAKVGRSDAAQLAALIEDELDASPRQHGEWEHLAHAYAVLGDEESFARVWAKALEVHLHEFGPRSAAFHASAAAWLQKEDMVPTSFWDHPAVVAVAEHYIALDTQDADEDPEEVAQEADVDDPARRGDDHGRE